MRFSVINNLNKIIKVKKPPVVTIMGHVDHGKTTLLDYLRNSQIVKQEFGGITQHIGAFVVPFKQKKRTELVTFLDTPGHAAFHSMRQRGANVTDIVVLVVACDDGVLDQTIESIRFAKKSEVPIIVAVNKIDKFTDQNELNKSLRYIRQQLIVHDVISEADGGEVQLVKISALKGIGVEDLKESILALAETLLLEAEINCPAGGHVIESLVHPHRGKLCTVLVDKGQIKKGDYLISGTTNWCKVRALFDERQQMKQECGPGLPIQVIGWRGNEVPSAGDPVMQVPTEAEAKRIITQFQQEKVLERAQSDAEQAAERARQYYEVYREKLKEKQESGFRYRPIRYHPRGQRPKQDQDDPMADLKINVLLKCDVDGSLEAILEMMDSYDKDNRQTVKLDIMHYGVGAITENDLLMASSFPNSVIYGFNVKAADQKIMLKAKQSGVTIKLYNVIYHLYDDLKLRISEKLPEQEKEEELGRADVLQEFVVKEKKKKGVHVAGCRCTRGILRKDCKYKLIRNRTEVIAEDLKVYTLKHLKDEVSEIEKDKECGISFMDHEDLEFKPGDALVAYEMKKFKPKLKWDLKGFT